MKTTEFKKLLKEKRINFIAKGKKIEINGGNVDLSSLTSLPEGTSFSNGGYVYLRSLTSLPEGTSFSNGGDVDLRSLTSLPEGTSFSNGGNVDLRSLTSLPEGTSFSNGGYVDLRSERIGINTPYLTRFKVQIVSGFVTLFKKVSHDFKTQEETENETLWTIGTTLTHPNWNPTREECGEGKFHACAKPYWCDGFRNNKGDRYIAIEIPVSDLFEWKDLPSYPYKIAFRSGKVIGECDRSGNLITLNT